MATQTFALPTELANKRRQQSGHIMKPKVNNTVSNKCGINNKILDFIANISVYISSQADNQKARIFIKRYSILYT
jgi:hypothetical protein